MIEGFERLGVSVNHVWGMTETSPSGTSPQPSRRTAKLSSEEKVAQKTSQGHPLYGVDLKIATISAMSCRATGNPPDG